LAVSLNESYPCWLECWLWVEFSFWRAGKNLAYVAFWLTREPAWS
jgi:hypothetical protein